MTRDETVALFEACEAKRGEARAVALAQGKSKDEARAIAHEAAKAHWNAWAGPLLAERKAMEADGRWAAEKDWRGSLEPENAETRAWMEKAAADFSRCLFLVRGGEGTQETAGEHSKEDGSGEPPVKSIQLEGNGADFSGFVFPGTATFESATFSGYATFESATFSGDARFASTTFAGNATFASATFESATFESATFSGRARFESATFTGPASFESATFTGNANFKSATFNGNARFESATFTGPASFDSATFSGDASFKSTTFSGNARFESATFTGNARFESARFRSEANFIAINSQRAFRLIDARFQWRVPDFLSAKFAEPVLLDNVQLAAGIEPGGLLRSIFGGLLLWITGGFDAALSAKYRALKRLAIQSDDHRNEQIFFRGELRGRRYNEDKPWHPAFWVGILYEVASDFGRSILRPILLLFALSLVSSWFYLGRHTLADVSPRAQLQARFLSHLPDRTGALFAAAQPAQALSCKQGKGDPAAAAVLLAIRQSSVIGALDSSKNAQIYTCLYGTDGDPKAPVVPGAVVLWGIGQTLLSAALWFLFLLALRNQFKIK